jgi:hypothetical protein
VEFEYDETKSQSNLEKHGIDFKEAREIWDAPVLEIGRAIRQDEERITIVGNFKGDAFTVVYTWRGENIRIISARRAHRTERAARDNAIR